MAVFIGDTVEICCEEDGFWGAYYVAKVLEKKSQNKFLVEYTTLVTEDDEKVFLKETVDAHMVRPLPPVIKVSEFKPWDKVDAYDNDGWWEGRITGRRGSDYSVYFETTGELLEYPVSCLRPHREYVHGKWVSFLRKSLHVNSS